MSFRNCAASAVASHHDVLVTQLDLLGREIAVRLGEVDPVDEGNGARRLQCVDARGNIPRVHSLMIDREDFARQRAGS